MTIDNLEKGDTVNRHGFLSIDKLTVGDVSEVNSEDIYNPMRINGVNVKGEFIDTSDLYYTRNQEIDTEENYIIFFDLKEEINFPVKESIVKELLGDYIFKVN